MKTKPWAIGLVIFFTLLTSAGQILFKMASANLAFDPVALILNWPLWVGGIVYATAAVLMIISFRGGELSVLYPIVSLSYVWVSLLSPRFFATDSMNPLKWIGVACIIGGVSLIGVGSQK